MNLKNRSGFSLPQVIIAIGLLSILSLVSLNLIGTMMKSSSRQNVKFGADSMGSYAKSLLAYETTCTPAFDKTVLIKESNVGQELPVRFSFKDFDLGSGVSLPKYGVMIKSFSMHSLQKVGNAVGKNYFVGELYISEGALGEIQGGKDFKERSLGPLNIVAKEDGTFVKCGSMPFNIEQVTQKLPAGTPLPSPAELQVITNEIQSPTCQLECVVKEWYARNWAKLVAEGNVNGKMPNPEIAAMAWMNTYAPGNPEGKTWASIAQGYVSAVDAAVKGGLYSQSQIDNWIIQGGQSAQLIDGVLNGYATANNVFGADTVREFATNPATAPYQVSAYAITGAAPPGTSASEIGATINQAMQQYTPAQIENFFATGGTWEQAQQILNGH